MLQQLEFHNTNGIRGEQLKQADERAISQKEWIKEFFNKFPSRKTPSAVKDAFDVDNHTEHLNGGSGVLVTSIRRAMCNLTKGPEGSAPHLRKVPNLLTKSPRGGAEGYWERNIPKESSLFDDM